MFLMIKIFYYRKCRLPRFLLVNRGHNLKTCLFRLVYYQLHYLLLRTFFNKGHCIWPDLLPRSQFSYLDIGSFLSRKSHFQNIFRIGRTVITFKTTKLQSEIHLWRDAMWTALNLICAVRKTFHGGKSLKNARYHKKRTTGHRSHSSGLSRYLYTLATLERDGVVHRALS